MSKQNQQAAKLRDIPAVDVIQHDPAMAEVMAEFGSAAAVRAVREVLDAVRADVLAGGDMPGLADIVSRCAARTAISARVRMRHVVNAAGIVLHTGLGRAALPKAAVDALADVSKGYCNLAFDLDEGERAERCRYVEQLLCEITGAEAAHVANNNAAATVLALNSLADGREGIVSRGQLVEIGGAFRIPDVMERSGVKLVEVGTTNRTHLRDYENAVTDETGLLLRVHHSNYRIIGFTGEVPIGEMAEVAHRYGLPVMDDLGSGALLDFAALGLDDEPRVAESVKAGADLITFSADKLIGGPQGGVLIGSKQAITRVRKNPWARILRVGKLDLVALEATLKLFLDKDRMLAENPTLRMLRVSASELLPKARRLAANIRKAAPKFEAVVVDEQSQVGSGSMPGRTLPTKAVAITLPGTAPDRLAKQLRLSEPPIFTRVKDDRVVMDLRTILDGEAKEIVNALATIAGD